MLITKVYSVNRALTEQIYVINNYDTRIYALYSCIEIAVRRELSDDVIHLSDTDIVLF